MLTGGFSLIEGLPPVLVGIFAAGISLAFLLADRQSPSTRAFALFLGLTAVAFASVPVRGPGLVTAPALWERVSGLLEAAVLASSCEWLYRVRRTISPAARASARSACLLRAAQACAGLYALGVIVFAGTRHRYSGDAWSEATLTDPVFLLLFAPAMVGFVLEIGAAVVIGRAEIDVAERVRLRAAGLSLPFLFSGLPMQPPWEYLTTAVGEVILLAGAVRYHVMQGQRSHFLGRFLSPGVAQLVRERGLAAALEQRRGEITVVAFDLRGFTAFVETAAPEQVMDIVQRYYAAVGEVATRAGGTIKDFAGDGILCLVGAPLADPDHARHAVLLARAGIEATRKFFGAHGALALAAGVATGVVTTGAVGGETRLEYAAVGPAVNLAARLCSQAGAAEIVCDAATVALAGTDGFELVGELHLKGIDRAVTAYRERLATA